MIEHFIGKLKSDYDAAIPGAAKVWALCNGTTATNSDDFNVSSITDVGAGVQTQNLTASFASANYAIATAAYRNANPNRGGNWVNWETLAAGAITLKTGAGSDASNNAVVEDVVHSVTAFGDPT